MLDLMLPAAASPSPLPRSAGVDEIKVLIDVWTCIRQALVASVGSLEFIFALPCMPKTQLPGFS